MWYYALLAVTHLAAFVAGALVFRNNAKQGEAVVQTAKTVAADASKAADAAKSIVTKS